MRPVELHVGAVGLGVAAFELHAEGDRLDVVRAAATFGDEMSRSATGMRFWVTFQPRSVPSGKWLYPTRRVRPLLNSTSKMLTSIESVSGGAIGVRRLGGRGRAHGLRFGSGSVGVRPAIGGVRVGRRSAAAGTRDEPGSGSGVARACAGSPCRNATGQNSKTSASDRRADR